MYREELARNTEQYEIHAVELKKNPDKKLYYCVATIVAIVPLLFVDEAVAQNKIFRDVLTN